MMITNRNVKGKQLGRDRDQTPLSILAIRPNADSLGAWTERNEDQFRDDLVLMPASSRASTNPKTNSKRHITFSSMAYNNSWNDAVDALLANPMNSMAMVVLGS